MALLCAEYGWTPDVVAGLTPEQVQYFGDRLPIVSARRHYPTAKLHAAVLNALGGKADPSEKSDKPPKPAHLFYQPEELMPWYASFGDSETAVVLPSEAAKDLMNNTGSLPTWALDIAPIEEAKRVLA